MTLSNNSGTHGQGINIYSKNLVSSGVSSLVSRWALNCESIPSSISLIETPKKDSFQVSCGLLPFQTCFCPQFKVFG